MLRIRVGLAACGLALAVVLASAGIARAQNELKSPTMDAIKKRGELICGIDTGIPGYAFQDSKGEWQGLDVAYCRAIADALLGSPTKVKFIGTDLQGAVLGPAVGRDRRADPRFRGDLRPQHAARPR